MAAEPSGAPASLVAFDTDVLIWYFRGSERARSFLQGFPHQNRLISALTVMKLIQGCRGREEVARVKAFVSENVSATVYPEEHTSRTAIRLLEEHAQPDGLRVVDALLAATALETGAALATANARHYRPIRGLRLIAFRPES